MPVKFSSRSMTFWFVSFVNFQERQLVRIIRVTQGISMVSTINNITKEVAARSKVRI